MRCPECDGEDTIEITINLTGDDRVKFFSCRNCESKWWERGGDTIALDEVLGLAARKESIR